MAKAFSIEDGNLQSQISVSVQRSQYSDIDLMFTPKPSGDIYKKLDAAAVKQSVKNLLLTNFYEKPFEPNYGGNLNAFLFALDAEFNESEVKRRVFNAIENYEPRARALACDAKINGANNSISVSVLVRVVSTNEEVNVNVSLTRVR